MKNKKGFTLVELLAVIAILAILVIIAMPNVLGLFTKSRIRTNLIVVENYATVGEEYFTSQFGESSDFNGKINVASKLSITGKRADVEKVYVTKDGEVAVYLQIDNYCYYKPFGAEEAIYTENIELCDTDTYISGMPIVPVENGSGLYDDGDRLVYKSNTSSISGSMYNTYCDFNLTKHNTTSDCDGKEILNNSKYSELIKQEDDVNNWIYFNCKDYTDVSSCEKWRIISYNYDENGGGNLKLISPDLKKVHFTSNDKHIAQEELINGFDKLYYDEYLTDSAKSLITKATYYSGKVLQGDSMDITFSDDVVQSYNSWNLNNIYSDSYEDYYGYLDVYEWFSASTNNICLQGIEHFSDYSSYNREDIPFSECNNWLNDGSFFALDTFFNNSSRKVFVGELGTISRDFPGDNGTRPVVTLKSQSYIIGGDGTNSNPYVLKYDNVQHVLTLKEEFLEKVKKMYVDANNSSLSTLYYASDNHKLNGYDDLEYVIQKENGKVNSMIVKEGSTQLFKFEKGDNFDHFSIDEVSKKYSKASEYTNDKLLGLDSVHSWDKNCTGKNTLNCKIVQSTSKSVLRNNDYTDENNDGLGGNIYYYTGNQTNIYVKFAGYCWKIVRTNENGSVKLLYAGEYTSSGCSSSTTGITGSTLAYNTDKSYAHFVGYMYGGYSNSYEISNRNITSSNIKNEVDNWYKNNILTKGSSVTSKIANTIYCNDRSVSNESTSGFAMKSTSYPKLTNSFKCKNKNDQFTLSVENGGTLDYGNNALTYPIALPTAAELAFSGIGSTASSNKYLSNWVWNYWTMTPNVYKNSSRYYGAAVAIAFHNYNNEKVSLSDYYVTVAKAYALPSISLKSSVVVSSGTGTASNPYVIN